MRETSERHALRSGDQEIPKLTSRVQCGDLAAMQPLLRKLGHYALHVSRGILQNQQDAEDVAQDVLHVLADGGLCKISDPLRTLAYVKKMTRRAAVRAVGRRDRRAQIIIAFRSLCESKVDDLEAELQRQWVHSRIEELESEEHKQVLRYRYFWGLSAREIAAKEKCSEAAVKSRLNRARQALAKKLVGGAR